jgi:hypothetical protein
MNNNKNEFSTLIKVKVEATINDPLKLTEIFYVISQDNYHSLINDIKNDPEFFLNRNNNIQDFSLEKLDFENSKITVLDLVKEIFSYTQFLRGSCLEMCLGSRACAIVSATDQGRIVIL